jgi:hypothetical protein
MKTLNTKKIIADLTAAGTSQVAIARHISMSPARVSQLATGSGGTPNGNATLLLIGLHADVCAPRKKK